MFFDALERHGTLATLRPLPLHIAQVYEHLVFGSSKHVTIRSLPGMKERTIRLGSAGKTFSFTAWKVLACSVFCIKRSYKDLILWLSPTSLPPW